jgi:hypothetical protein
MTCMLSAIGSRAIVMVRAIIVVAAVAGSWAGAAEPAAAEANPPGDGGPRAAAFAAFERLPAAVNLPTGNPSDLFGVPPLSRSSRQVDLGALALKDLLGPSFRLAVPEETISGQPFDAEIVAVDQGDAGPRWEIRQLVGGAPLGEPPGPRTLATLAEQDGRAILEVERAALGSRGLAILRRCVILAAAVNPRTKQLAVREIRLVTPTRVRPLVTGIRDGTRAITVPVPAGIVSRDAIGGRAAVNLALPVKSLELEAEWGGRPVAMRWPRAAGGLQEPGVGRWMVTLGKLEDGAELGLTVTLSLPQATLQCVPCLMGATGKVLDLEALVGFVESRADALSRIGKKFRARVEACPLRDYQRSRGDHGRSDFVGSWFDVPLATEESMTIGLPGHETVRSSLDLYLQEEYARLKQQLAEDWSNKLAAMPDGNAKTKAEYFGAPLPEVPKDFASWQNQWRGARESEWEAMFRARLTAWSEWFWRKFEARWGRDQAGVREALEKTVELRILEIRSIARDAPGAEYRVPLVVLQPGLAIPGVEPAGRASPAGQQKEGQSPRDGDAVSGPD